MNKQAQNTATQKFPVIWILAAGALVVGLSGWVAFSHYQKNQDRARFSEAETTKADIVKQLQEDLGDKALQVTENNQCFNTEQGPYDEGKLWCQTSTVLSLNDSVTYQELGEKIIAIAKSKGLSVSKSGDLKTQRFGFYAVDIGCAISFKTIEDEVFGSSTLDVVYDLDATVAAVSCADRAKAKHYPFTE